jgi:hypothetical protein
VAGKKLYSRRSGSKRLRCNGCDVLSLALLLWGKLHIKQQSKAISHLPHIEQMVGDNILHLKESHCRVWSENMQNIQFFQ